MSPAELRRLLELAAKAMGYTTTHSWNEIRMTLDPPVIALVVHKDGELVTTGWNPADDDGESRRLEVALEMEHCHYGAVRMATVKIINRWLPKQFLQLEEYYSNGDDPAAASRLVVLRAAAAIGEAMP